MDSPHCNKPNVSDESSMISKVNIFIVHNSQVFHACCHVGTLKANLVITLHIDLWFGFKWLA